MRKISQTISPKNQKKKTYAIAIFMQTIIKGSATYSSKMY